MDLRPGASAEITDVVRAERTADALGNPGVKVFATPFLVGFLEEAAGAILRPHLAPGAITVGTLVNIRHLAATPVGMKIRAKATLVETDGRRFVFDVEASDEREKIAEGRHERFLVTDGAKFHARAMQKAVASAEHRPTASPAPDTRPPAV